MMNEIGFDDVDIKTLRCQLVGKKMCDHSDTELKRYTAGLLARIGIITGIEIPSNERVFELLVSELSKVISTDKHYQKLTYEEYIHAFTMVSRGDFGDIKDWGKSMNLKYFNEVMMAYLRHKTYVLYRFWDWQGLTSLRIQEYITPKENFQKDFRPTIERCYQDFLKDQHKPYLWPYQCYDYLESIELIPYGQYKKFEKPAIQKLMAELNMEIMRSEKTKIKVDGNLYSTRDQLPILIGRHMQMVGELSDIRTGGKKVEVEIRSKQLCLLAYFKQQAMEGKECLYKVVSANEHQN